jgi:hypothetical protein
MATKFKLITTAQHQLEENKTFSDNVITTLNELQVLPESVTHVLSNIAVKAEEGQPIALADAKSVAAFMAGVEIIASKLPQADEAKRENTIRRLAAMSVGPDGLISTNCVPVAEVGSKYPNLVKTYLHIIQQYTVTKDGQELANAAKKLKLEIGRAIGLAVPAVA